jgi:arylformamidase
MFAQQTIGPKAHTKGPKVFLDYDQADLDAAYDQQAYAPNMQQLQQRWVTNSELFRSRWGMPMRFSYGKGKAEQLDVYRSRKPSGPVQVFIHGGAWRSGLAKNFAFLADLFIDRGAHLVIPDFVAVQDAGGSLTVMAHQVQQAVIWVSKNALTFGGDRHQIYLSGHSSGAHLAAVALTQGRKALGGAVKGALLVSGIYDLNGPRLSSRSAYVHFDDAVEEALSPHRHIDRIATPLILAYGSLDTPEFQRQSREFASALKAAGKRVELIQGENYNHFEFIETLANPYGILGRAALSQMNLSI